MGDALFNANLSKLNEALFKLYLRDAVSFKVVQNLANLPEELKNTHNLVLIIKPLQYLTREGSEPLAYQVVDNWSVDKGGSYEINSFTESFEFLLPREYLRSWYLVKVTP